MYFLHVTRSHLKLNRDPVPLMMEHYSAGTMVSVAYSGSIEYYAEDVSNSLFVVVEYGEGIAYCLKSDIALKCWRCNTITIDMHVWSSLGHECRCLKCAQLSTEVEWPRGNVHCGPWDGNDDDDYVSMTLSLTLHEMLLNIATAPSGRFCTSCRMVESKSGVCGGCAKHILTCARRWMLLLEIAYFRHRVPLEVSTLVYQLML